MNFLLALALSVVSTSQTNLRCMTRGDFDRIFDSSYGSAFSRLISSGEEMTIGEFGKLTKTGNGDSQFVIKRSTVALDTSYLFMDREIISLKLMCGVDPNLTFTYLMKCNSEVIAGFLGCVEDTTDLYIIQRKVGKDLSSEYAVDLYSRLSTLEKIDFMLQIIFKLEEVHRRGIVHGSVSPRHLAMKGSDFSDIRILDFRKSGQKGQELRLRGSCFSPPEQERDYYLYPMLDTYSLAITFAMMEKSMSDYKPRKVEKDCREKYLQGFLLGVRGAFNKDNGTELLKDIMLKAINEDPAKRYKSMADFGAAIQAVRDQLSPPKPQDDKPNDDQKKGWTWNYFKGLVGLGSGDGRRVLTLEAGSQVSHPKGRGLGAQQEDRVIL